MDKGILITDFPKCCALCKLAINDPSGLYCVPANKYFDGKDSSEEKPGWCPVKFAPLYKEDRGNFTFDELKYISGYNDCLEKIMGE